LNRIDPEFFATMKIPLLRGRNLRPGETNAVVVSDSLARILWRGGEALGEQFSVGAEKYPVVGVVANARANALADGDAVEVYQTAGERDLPAAAVLVRVAGPAENRQQAVAGTARRIDARVVPAIQTLSSAFARKIENTRQSAAAVSVLGSVALLLACTGIVGVVAYAVSQREKEIGIRMALGSGRSHLLRVIVRQFWAPIAAGLGAGAAAAAGLTQFLRGELYGVSPLDPLAYAAATTLLALTAAAAVLVPARRALRVDAMRALRSE
jgi:ABC-type antimicrobial peptide transport system permease subunit